MYPNKKKYLYTRKTPVCALSALFSLTSHTAPYAETANNSKLCEQINSNAHLEKQGAHEKKYNTNI